MEQDEIEQQIARCHRLASLTIDDEARHALELLAEEYEAMLPSKTGSFMLGSELSRKQF
jgi:hypothetical protein